MKNNIKFLRRSEEFNITQQELANAIGVSKYTIVRIEQGESTSAENVFKIANYFGKDPRDIFFISNGAHVHQNKQTS